MKKGQTTTSLGETIFFYTRNDYLIVNNLLCGDLDRLWQVAEIVNNDSKGVLKEHEDGLRTLEQKSVAWYQGRIYEKLDDETRSRILQNARKDISNILNAMVPTKDEMMLYRNVRVGDVLTHCQPNDVVEFKIISSASSIPVDQSFGHDSDFYRYEITVPKNAHVLELNQFEYFIRNEDNEVLLPPMRCIVKNVRNDGSENCKGIVEFGYLDRLPVVA